MKSPRHTACHEMLAGDLLGSIQRHAVEPFDSPAGRGIAWHNDVKTVADVMQRFVEAAEARSRAASGPAAC